MNASVRSHPAPGGDGANQLVAKVAVVGDRALAGNPEHIVFPALPSRAPFTEALKEGRLSPEYLQPVPGLALRSELRSTYAWRR